MPTEKQRVNNGNLKPWRKGQSGNPAGRPKKVDSLTSLLKEELQRIDPSDKEGRTWNERIVLATLRLAEQGVPAALKEVWDRIDGKVKTDLAVDSATEVVFRWQTVEDQLDDAEPSAKMFTEL